MIAGVEQDFLGALHREGRFIRKALCEFAGFFEQGFLSFKAAIHQSKCLGFTAENLAGGEGEFQCNPVGDEMGQALESAHIGGDREINFLDLKDGSGGAVAQIAGRHLIHPGPNASSVDGGQHGLATTLDRGE